MPVLQVSRLTCPTTYIPTGTATCTVEPTTVGNSARETNGRRLVETMLPARLLARPQNRNHRQRNPRGLTGGRQCNLLSNPLSNLPSGRQRSLPNNPAGSRQAVHGITASAICSVMPIPEAGGSSAPSNISDPARVSPVEGARAEAAESGVD
ncbi:MAG: hypothetical protein HGJ94_11840 [Desulfosarcina sp.]|nr:hypothetical protein [Desulfosarcina sp.]